MKPASTKIIVIKGRLNPTSAGGVALPTSLESHVNLGLIVALGKDVSKCARDAEVVMFNGYIQSASWDDIGTRQGHVVIDEVSVLATFPRDEAEKMFNVTFEPEGAAVAAQ